MADLADLFNEEVERRIAEANSPEGLAEFERQAARRRAKMLREGMIDEAGQWIDQPESEEDEDEDEESDEDRHRDGICGVFGCDYCESPTDE